MPSPQSTRRATPSDLSDDLGHNTTARVLQKHAEQLCYHSSLPSNLRGSCPLFTAETVCENNPQISNETVNILLTSRETLKDTVDSYQKIIRARIKVHEWAVRVLGGPRPRLPGIIVTTKESRKRGRLVRKGYRNRLHRSKTILGKWKGIEKLFACGDESAQEVQDLSWLRSGRDKDIASDVWR